MKIETVEQYIKAAMRTKSPHCALSRVESQRLSQLLATSIVAGGMARDIKKAIFSGKPYDDVPHELSLLSTPLAKMNPDVLHAVLGILNEAGEIAEALLRITTGESADFINMDEEFGDSEWFRALYLVGRGIPVQQLWERNIAKLKARYPEKFDGDQMDDENRNKDAEGAALRGERA